MKARTAIAWTAHRVRLTAVGWGLTTILACVALSACTSSGTPSGSVTVLSPTASSPSESPSESASAHSPASESASISPSESASESASPSFSPFPSPSPSPIPTEAPVTGGGGTAGFQDAGLAVLGGTAIAAGLASIAYRRRITRRR